MDDVEERRASTAARWAELIDELADEVDSLAVSFITEVDRIASYSSGVIEATELQAVARQSFTLILESTILERVTDTLEGFALNHGKRRARQRIAVEDVVAAIRLDFRVIWSALLQRAGTDDALVLALHVDTLWSIVDAYAHAVHQSHVYERAAMAATARDVQRTYLAELFASGGLILSKVDEIARALELTDTTEFDVLVTRKPFSEIVHGVANQMLPMSVQLFVYSEPTRTIAFWPSTQSNPLPSALARLRQVTGGYCAEVRALSAVPAAADTAARIAGVLGPDDRGWIELADAWPRLTKSQFDQNNDFTDRLLSRLDATSDDERHRIIETVRAYLDSGSISVVSQQMFLHRNTVQNRLNRFTTLTGLDITVPSQAALALLAFG